MRKITVLASGWLAIATVHAGDAPPAIAALHDYVGSWNCQGAFASGKKIASTITFSSDLDGAALVKHHDDLAQSGSYHAIEAWVYDADKHQLTAAIADNFGGVRRFTAMPTGSRDLQWNLQASGQPQQQFIYTTLDRDHFRLDWKIEKPGKGVVLGDTLTCTRRD
jgi:hypothetical protein